MLCYDTKRIGVKDFKDVGFLDIDKVLEKYGDDSREILFNVLTDHDYEFDNSGYDIRRDNMRKLLDYAYIYDILLTPDTYLFYVFDSGLVVQANTEVGYVTAFWRSGAVENVSKANEELTALLSRVDAELAIDPSFIYEIATEFTEEEREAHDRACDIDDAING